MEKYYQNFLLLFVIVVPGSVGLIWAHSFDETYTSRCDDIELIAVTIPRGDLIGKRRYLPDGSSFRSFEGIPYAVPPIGELRFRDPIAAPIWTEPFDAIDPGPMCTQIDPVSLETSGYEDCLYLNVYSPDINSEVLYPVLFYIHGGGLMEGSSHYANNPDLFIRDGIIVVAINYRLGVFGFLNLDIADVPGNAAHKDQALALHWVAENIESLGGDPNNIAVAGHSAGSISAHYLHISNMSKNCIHKLIALGASPTADLLLFQDRHNEAAYILGRMLNISMADPTQFALELRRLSPQSIIDAALGGTAPDGSTHPDVYYQFHTSVEQQFQGQEAFLTKLPHEFLETGEFSDIPAFIGYTSKEGVSFSNNLESLLLDPFTFVRGKWGLIENSEEMESAINSVKEYYFGSREIDFSDHSMVLRLMELKGDTMFIVPIIEVVRYLVRFSSEPIYLMRFSYRGGLNDDIIDSIGIQGATHGDELFYFLPRETPRIDDYSADGWVRRRVGKIIANFIKFGDPTPSPTTHLLPTKWVPVSEDVMHYMNVNSDPIPSVNPEGDKIRFWDELEQIIMTSN